MTTLDPKLVDITTGQPNNYKGFPTEIFTGK